MVWCTQLPAAPADSTLLCIDGEAILGEFSWDGWMALLHLASLLAQAPGTDHTHPKAKIVTWYVCAFSVSSINDSRRFECRFVDNYGLLDAPHNHTRRQDSCARNHVDAEVNFWRFCLWELAIPLNRLSQETAHSISPERHKISIGSGGEIRSVLACHSMVD